MGKFSKSNPLVKFQDQRMKVTISLGLVLKEPKTGKRI